MSEPFDIPLESETPVVAETPPVRKKGYAGIAWLVILISIGSMMARNLLERGPDQVAQQDRLQGIVFDMQARALVGEANSFLPVAQTYEQAKSLDHGSWNQRLKFVILTGELVSAPAALEKAMVLENAMIAKEKKQSATPPTAQEKHLVTILENLYADYENGDFQATTLTNEDRDFLLEYLGWFGELALHPRAEPALKHAPERRAEIMDPARKTFGAVLGALISGSFLTLVGFIGLIMFVIFLANGYLTGGMLTGSGHGGVYAETFALYLCLYLVLGLLMPYLPWAIPPMAKAGLAIVGSLAVLAWPVLRGIPWATVRQDIGWTLGRAPAIEPALGIACYVMALPIVAIGLILTLLLMALANRLEALGLAQNQPVHPIIEFVVNGSNLDRFFVFFAACILAPIVEETMFRGVLYRHLREFSGRWAWLASVVFSGTIAAFVFAVIHPQGLVTIPVLMSLAYGFTIVREWRGSLIPSMVGHGLNNGMVMLLLLLAT